MTNKEQKTSWKRFYDKHRNDPEFKRKNAEKNRRYIEARRMKIIRLLGGKCARCGIDDPRVLCIDHVNSDGAEERRKYRHGKRGSSKKYLYHIFKEIEAGSTRYQLLCANCNLIKYREKREWERSTRNTQSV